MPVSKTKPKRSGEHLHWKQDVQSGEHLHWKQNVQNQFQFLNKTIIEFNILSTQNQSNK